jgi:hypothetical protein
VYVLEYDVRVGPIGHCYRGSRCQSPAVVSPVYALALLPLYTLDLLLARRVSQRDSHAKRSLRVVNCAQRALLIALLCSTLCGLDVLRALLLVPREGRDGESRARGGDGAIRLLRRNGGQIGRRGPPVRGRGARGSGAEGSTPGTPQSRADFRNRRGDAVSRRVLAARGRRGHFGREFVLVRHEGGSVPGLRGRRQIGLGRGACREDTRSVGVLHRASWQCAARC